MADGTADLSAGDAFEDPVAPRRAPDSLIIDVDGFEGPLDLLLTLAKTQKVDLRQISILALVEQYLAFVEAAKARNLELAADYLVMAAWLAYLKSRLLLPEPPPEDEPSAEEMATALAHRLRWLDALRIVGGSLMRLPRLGIDTFPRGAPEGMAETVRPVFEATLYDLLKAYATQRGQGEARSLHVAPLPLYSVEQALQRLRRLLGAVPDWTVLEAFLPALRGPRLTRRSALTSTFVATLEMAKAGEIELRQDEAFGPIHLRTRRPRTP